MFSQFWNFQISYPLETCTCNFPFHLGPSHGETIPRMKSMPPSLWGFAILVWRCFYAIPWVETPRPSCRGNPAKPLGYPFFWRLRSQVTAGEKKVNRWQAAKRQKCVVFFCSWYDHIACFSLFSLFRRSSQKRRHISIIIQSKYNLSRRGC